MFKLEKQPVYVQWLSAFICFIAYLTLSLSLWLTHSLTHSISLKQVLMHETMVLSISIGEFL